MIWASCLQVMCDIIVEYSKSFIGTFIYIYPYTCRLFEVNPVIYHLGVFLLLNLCMPEITQVSQNNTGMCTKGCAQQTFVCCEHVLILHQQSYVIPWLTILCWTAIYLVYYWVHDSQHSFCTWSNNITSDWDFLPLVEFWSDLKGAMHEEVHTEKEMITPLEHLISLTKLKGLQVVSMCFSILSYKYI